MLRKGMLSKVCHRFTYTNVAMTVAIVFAMSGGAFAAGRYVITSTSQIKPSVLKQLRGKSGAKGATGAAGVTGSQGPVGPAGLQGPEGKQGIQGKEGVQGKEGPAGATGGVLPKGVSLKGEWNASAPGGSAFNSVSFALSLPSEPTPHYIYPGEAPPAGCTGSVEDPGAAEGNLCVFAAAEVNSRNKIENVPVPTICRWEAANPCVPSQASIYGFGIEVVAEESEEKVSANGTWAVTAG